MPKLNMALSIASLSTFYRNFSKPAAPIVAQMFNFLNLGFDGYRDVARKDLRNARLLSKALESTKYFTVRFMVMSLGPYSTAYTGL